jgi:amidase
MPGDLFVAPAPSRPYQQEVGADPGRLKVGVLIHNPIQDSPIHPECVEAVERTGRKLESLGHHVEYSHPPRFEGPSGLGLALRIVGTSGAAATLDAWSSRTGKQIGPDDVEAETWASAEEGRQYSAVQMHAAIQRLMNGVCRSQEWWAAGFDLLITPTMARPPIKIGEKDREIRTSAFGLLNFPASLSGQPAISLPLHWSSEGLPIGVQIVADYGREDILIRIASQLEQAHPWADRWPLTHA